MSNLTGHIRMGGRDYMIEWAQYQKALANPFAAKLGNGAGKYDDLEDWSAWVMDDWTGGLSKRADEGGILWGDAETRYRERLMLPGRLQMAGHVAPQLSTSRYNLPGLIEGEYTVGSTEAVRAIIMKVGQWSDESSDVLWMLMRAAAGTEVTISVHTTLEGAAIDSWPATGGEEWPGYYYTKATLNTESETVNYIRIAPTNGELIYMPYTSTGANPENGLIYTEDSGGSWSATTNYGYFIGRAGSIAGASISNTSALIRRFDNTELSSDIFAISTGAFYGLVSAATGYGATSTYSAYNAVPADSAVFNGKLYMAYGDGLDMYTWTGTGAVAALSGVYAELLLAYRGYLFRAVGSDIYYTADGVTWVGPFTVGDGSYTITGLEGSGLSGDVYVSTTESLWVFAAGDIMLHAFAYGSISSKNGRSMRNYNGDLFIPHTHGVMRYTSTGNISEVWLSQEEDLPASRLGNVRLLLRANNYLYAMVDAVGEDEIHTTILAYDGQGWHYVAVLPPGISSVSNAGSASMYFDTDTSILWIGTEPGLVFYIYLPDVSSNPLRDANYEYAPFAWAETDWYDGGLIEIIKDFESVYIDSDDIENGSVTIYWQDVDSTAWELLGTVTTDGQEIIWSDFSTRPQSRRIKLGLLITTTDSSATPVIRAIRVKYHNMVNDRWRWQITVKAADNQQMWDKTVNPYDANSQRAHIQSMLTQTLPVKYVDVDGTGYNVKVQNAVETIEKLERVNQARRYDSRHTLTLAEV